MKILVKLLVVIVLLALVGVGAMAVFKICPPAGPWPMPPWCGAAASVLNQSGVQRAAPTASAPAAEESASAILVYLPGQPVNLDASQFLSYPESGASAVWTQLFYPDLYTGEELISGSALLTESPTATSLNFTPEWPGIYRFQLDLTASDGAQQTDVEVVVKPLESPFALFGAAMDYWNYSEKKAERISPDLFSHLEELGLQLVMFSPSWYMPSRTSTEISPCPLPEFDPEACRGVISDETLVGLIREAHARGLQVLIKPHLKILNGNSPEWPGYMEISDWGAWFQSYGDFVLHYADLARAEGVEHLSLGNELGNNCTSQTTYWRDLIHQVRSVYPGQLSYHDNAFSGEGSAVQFWDELDYIGVNVWTPASGVYGVPESNHPDVESMVQALDGQLAVTLDPVAAKFDKPVVITEVGTSNYDGSNHGFWEYSGPTDNGEQASFYEAALRTFAARPFIQGVIIWAYDWENSISPQQQTMSPLDKPAEEVLSLWLGVK